MIYSIIITIALTALMIVLLKIFKKAAKIIMIVFSVIMLLLITVGILMVKDAIDFKEGMQKGDITYIAVSGNEVISAIQTQSGMPEPIIINESVITGFDAYFKKGELDKIKGDAFKLFIVDITIFNDLGEKEIPNDYDGRNITSNIMVAVLNSSSPRDVFADYLLLTAKDVPEQYEDYYREKQKKQMESDNEVRGRAFIFLISQAMGTKGPLFIINGYKEGLITIYPETILFRCIRLVPTSYIKSVWKKKNIE